MRTRTIFGMGVAAILATSLRAADANHEALVTDQLDREPCERSVCDETSSSARAGVREPGINDVNRMPNRDERDSTGSDVTVEGENLRVAPPPPLANHSEGDDLRGSSAQLHPLGTSSSFPLPRSDNSRVTNSSASTTVASQVQALAVNLGGAGTATMRMLPASGTAVLFTLQSTIGSWIERYEYDAAGRLRKVTFGNGAITNYTLDNAGNRTNVSTTVP